MGREMLNPVPVMTFLNKDRYAAVVILIEAFVIVREVWDLWVGSTIQLVKLSTEMSA